MKIYYLFKIYKLKSENYYKNNTQLLTVYMYSERHIIPDLDLYGNPKNLFHERLRTS